MVKPSRFWIDITAFGVSKGAALQQLQSKLRYDREEILVFGDAENDRSMFEMAGVNVLMKNGMRSLKPVVDHTTKYNHDFDGVAQFIEQHILSQIN